MPYFFVFVYPWWLAAVLVLAALAWGRTLRLDPPSRKALALAAVLFGAALLIRLAIPTEHRVWWDEFEHLDAARHLAARSQYAISAAAGLDDLDVLLSPTWPGLWHVLAAALIRLGAAPASAPFLLNLLLGALAPCAVAAAASALWHDLKAGLAAGGMWAGLGLAARYSRAGDLSSLSVLTVALVLWAAARARDRRPGADWALAAALALAANARFENIALLPVVLVWLPERRRLALPLLTAALTAAPAAALAWSNHAAKVPGFDSTLGASLAAFAGRAPNNLFFLISSPDRALIGVLAVVGAVLASRRDAVLPLLAAAPPFLAATAYYHGDFTATSDARYALPVLVALCVLAGAPFARLRSAKWAAAAALCGVLLGWGRAAGAQDANHAAEWRALSAAPLPEDVYVLTVHPATIRALDRPAAGLDGLDDPRVREDIRRRGAVLLRDGWRAIRPDAVEGLDAAAKGFGALTPLWQDGGAGIELLRLTPKDDALSGPLRRSGTSY